MACASRYVSLSEARSAAVMKTRSLLEFVIRSSRSPPSSSKYASVCASPPCMSESTVTTDATPSTMPTVVMTARPLFAAMS